MLKRVVMLTGVMVLALSLAAPVTAGGAQTGSWPETFESGTITNFDPFTVGFMDCDLLKRVEKPDGSSKETMSCDLNGFYLLFEDPEGPPTDVCFDPLPDGEPNPQCGAPGEALRYSGGGCFTWMSDWSLLVNDGPDFDELEHVIYADRAEVVVTPSGKVHATTWYGADPLTLGDCLAQE